MQRNEDAEPSPDPLRQDGAPAEPDLDAEEDLLGGEPSDSALPISRTRRRLATTAAIVFIVGILTFLVWFAATHSEREPEPGMFGDASPRQPAGSLTTAPVPIYPVGKPADSVRTTRPRTSGRVATLYA